MTLASTSGGIDSSTPAGRMMIAVLGSLAEYERELIRERTTLKRQASRANGTRFGRPRKVADAQRIVTAKRMKPDGHTGKDTAKYLGVSRATMYRVLRRRHRCVIGRRSCGMPQRQAARFTRTPIRPRWPGG